jgi:hypothetical protein
LKRIIDDFSVLAVEKCVIQNLTRLFTPEIVYKLEESVISGIAAESGELMEQRADAMEMLQTLQSSLLDLARISRFCIIENDQYLPTKDRPS